MKHSLMAPSLALLGLLSMGSPLVQAQNGAATAASAKGTYETVLVTSGSSEASVQSVDATVEPVRLTPLAAQVAGAVVRLNVKAGDRVKAGQVLLQLDSSNAVDTAAANQALVEAAQSAWMVASRDWERQKQMFEKQYISQAALERAQGQRDTALARLQAAQAQARVASHQSHFYEITAPYDGVVSELNTALGDMALPGKVLLTVYDPRALRLRAFVPQSLRLQLPSGVRLSYELPQSQAMQAVTQYDWLPVADPGTHSVELRIPLQGLAGELQPGQFARVWLPVVANPGKSMQRLWIPLSATLRRAEMDGVYVQKPNGEVGLRQVRLGEARAGQVEVLSGLDLNERVVRDARVVSAKAP